jgi:tRNA(Ile)-lysidine synthase
MSKSALLPIEQAVQNQLKNYFGTAVSPSFVMGVSGGIDSMCMLHILQKLNVELYVVHINYQKRGEASDKDARLVAETAQKLNIDYEIIAVNPAEAEGENFQQWARDVRYDAFEAKLREIGADGIITAHQQDDQIETILLKLFRGGGLVSWTGMQAWNGVLFRPLLEISRSKIEKYCHENKIVYRDDESNFESQFARNFLRNEWAPELNRHFPGWRQNVLRIREQAAVFESSLQFILHTISDNESRLNRKSFLELDMSLQKAVLNYFIHQADQQAEISRGTLKEIEKLPKLQTGKSIHLTGQLELMRDRNFLKLVVNTEKPAAFLKLYKEDCLDSGIVFNGLQFKLQPFRTPDFKHRLYLDEDALKWPFHLRKWKKGDRFQPLGMNGRQTVADHLTNRKVIAVKKSEVLVLESFEETICAVIFPPKMNRLPPGTIADKVKCTKSTSRCLIIKRI